MGWNSGTGGGECMSGGFFRLDPAVCKKKAVLWRDIWQKCPKNHAFCRSVKFPATRDLLRNYLTTSVGIFEDCKTEFVTLPNSMFFMVFLPREPIMIMSNSFSLAYLIMLYPISPFITL